MPNLINENGIQIQTLEEVLAGLRNAYRNIYGVDINLSQSSPDAQLLSIFALAKVDCLELAVRVFNSFDPDKVTGRVQDMRYTINGIYRLGGSYTIQPIAITTSESLTLYGDDQTDNEKFTVSDNAGTEFVLMSTTVIPTAGTNTLIFRASETGKVEVIPNTITNPVTVVIGVTGINNPDFPITVGENEETDVNFRRRRQKSTSISAIGLNDALTASLLNINGIVDAKVYENTTGVYVNGIPDHSIWAVVAGTYSDEEVAMAIYKKRNMGCGMRGDRFYTITQKDGSSVDMKWDDVGYEGIFVKMTLLPIDNARKVDVKTIRTNLPSLFSSSIGGSTNINEIASLVRQVDNNALVSTCELSHSLLGIYSQVISASLLKNKLILESAKIIILPMQIYPSNIKVAGGVDPESRTFEAYGGYGAYTWTVEVNNSGGSIDANGVYTAGAATSTTDTIRATDTQGNYVETTVEVI